MPCQLILVQFLICKFSCHNICNQTPKWLDRFKKNSLHPYRYLVELMIVCWSLWPTVVSDSTPLFPTTGNGGFPLRIRYNVTLILRGTGWQVSKIFEILWFSDDVFLQWYIDQTFQFFAFDILDNNADEISISLQCSPDGEWKLTRWCNKQFNSISSRN